jgi:homoserine kinase type II
MAVYTDIGEVELGAFPEKYAIGELLSYKGIAEGVGELEFPAAHDERRLYPDALRKAGDPADLPFFLGLMQHLSERGHELPAAGFAQ